MSMRTSRRAVFAELLLMASPVEMAERADGVSLSLRFATIAELRAWLQAAGLDTPGLLTGEHTVTVDGRPCRSMTAYPTWRGWTIYAHATDYTDPPPLSAELCGRLAALTAA